MPVASSSAVVAAVAAVAAPAPAAPAANVVVVNSEDDNGDDDDENVVSASPVKLVMSLPAAELPDNFQAVVTLISKEVIVPDKVFSPFLKKLQLFLRSARKRPSFFPHCRQMSDTQDSHNVIASLYHLGDASLGDLFVPTRKVYCVYADLYIVVDSIGVAVLDGSSCFYLRGGCVINDDDDEDDDDDAPTDGVLLASKLPTTTTGQLVGFSSEGLAVVYLLVQLLSRVSDSSHTSKKHHVTLHMTFSDLNAAKVIIDYVDTILAEVYKRTPGRKKASTSAAGQPASSARPTSLKQRPPPTVLAPAVPSAAKYRKTDAPAAPVAPVASVAPVVDLVSTPPIPLTPAVASRLAALCDHIRALCVANSQRLLFLRNKFQLWSALAGIDLTRYPVSTTVYGTATTYIDVESIIMELVTTVERGGLSWKTIGDMIVDC